MVTDFMTCYVKELKNTAFGDPSCSILSFGRKYLYPTKSSSDYQTDFYLAPA